MAGKGVITIEDVDKNLGINASSEEHINNILFAVQKCTSEQEIAKAKEIIIYDEKLWPKLATNSVQF